MPANTEASFQFTVNSDKPVEVFLKKGITQDLPDAVNYDIRITNETDLTLSSNILNLEQGAIMAVHCTGEETDVTTFAM